MWVGDSAFDASTTRATRTVSTWSARLAAKLPSTKDMRSLHRRMVVEAVVVHLGGKQVSAGSDRPLPRALKRRGDSSRR